MDTLIIFAAGIGFAALMNVGSMASAKRARQWIGIGDGPKG